MEQGLDLVRCMRRNSKRISKGSEDRFQFVPLKAPALSSLKEKQEKEKEMLDWFEESLHQ